MRDVTRRGFLKTFGGIVGSAIMFPGVIFKKEYRYLSDVEPTEDGELIPDYGYFRDGPLLEVSCVPNKKLYNILKRNDRKGRGNANILIKFTYKNNWEVTNSKSKEIFDGRILSCTQLKYPPYYYLKVEVFSVIDLKGNRFTPRRIRELSYEGAIDLKDLVILNGCIARKDHFKTGGYGVVMSIDREKGNTQVAF